MVRLRRAVVVATLAAISLAPVAARPAPPVVDPFGPGPEECRVDPRPVDELRAIVGVAAAAGATPAVGVATPVGDGSFPPVEPPMGGPVDAATAAEVRATVRQLYACRNAGDVVRYIALFSDDAIRRGATLSRLAAAVVSGEIPSEPEPRDASQWRHFAGLFHLRLQPDGSVAAIAPPGFLGVVERFDFVRVGGRWLIDDVTPVIDTSAPAGVVGSTFTGERHQSHMDLEQGIVQVGGFGYGVAWDAEWQPLAEPAPGFQGSDLTLTNGISLVVFGFPLGDPNASLATCVAPDFADPAAAVWQSILVPAYFDHNRGIVPATTADGRPLRGADGDRAFAVYDIGYRSARAAADAESYRLYLECRAMAGGAWVLGITQLVPMAAYDGENAAREALLAAIES